MASVEGGRLFEEPKPEKKRYGLGEGCESVEEPKRQKMEDEYEDQIMDFGDDLEADFNEGDSDCEKDDDFEVKGVDFGFWGKGDEAFPYLDQIDKEEDRGCLNKSVCSMYQHKSEFDGVFLFELFKVKLKFNHKVNPYPLKGEFCGVVESLPAVLEPDFQPTCISYYRVSEKQPAFIQLNSDNNMTLLPLSGPEPRPPIFHCDLVALDFAFKLNHIDVFKWGISFETPGIFGDGCSESTAKCEPMGIDMSFRSFTRESWCSPIIERACIGEPDYDDILFFPYFSIYYGAWGTVRVEILKKDVSSYSGFIYARPCIFRKRICFLSIQSDQKLKLEKSGSVKLTRSVVAVPSYASLIIAAVLYDQDGKQIVRGKTFFPALEKGFGSKYIKDEDGIKNLGVTVEWACEP